MKIQESGIRGTGVRRRILLPDFCFLFPVLLRRYTALLITLFLTACGSGGYETPICTTTGPCTQAPTKATSRPYQIKGVWHYPQAHYEYDQVGVASYYGGGDVFHGRATATGERFDMNGVTAAHKTLPLPCMAEVSNLENGRQIIVKVNDRGPFVGDRMIDVSRRVAQLLGFEQKGTAQVRVRTLVPESLALNGITAPTVMLAQAVPAPVPVVVAAPLPAPVPAAASIPSFVAVAAAAVPAEAPAPAPVPVFLAQADPVPALPANTGIFVDVGRYATHEEAHASSKRLRGVGEAPTTLVKTSGSTPYAVRIGPLASMSAASQLADTVGQFSRIIIQR